jgi:hypothetical protein
MIRLGMTGGQSRGGEHFDLLPFINILMCTLGCLLLIALSMASLSLGSAPEDWRVVPDSDSASQHKVPILLTWDGKMIVAQLASDGLCMSWPPNLAMDQGSCPPGTKLSDFEALSTYLGSRKSTHYALIAVRPSGFENFRELTKALTAQGISIGYEPISQAKQVRLSSTDGTN